MYISRYTSLLLQYNCHLLMYPYPIPPPPVPTYYADDNRIVRRYETNGRPELTGPFFVVKMGHRPGIYRARHIARRMTENFPDTTPTSWDTEEEALAWLYSPYMHELVLRNEYSIIKRVVYCHGVLQGVQSGTMGGLGCYFGQSNECNFSGPLVGTTQTKTRVAYAAVLQALKIISYRREHYLWQIRSTSAGIPKTIAQARQVWRTSQWHNSKIVPEEGKDVLEAIMTLLDRFIITVEINCMLDFGPVERQASSIHAVEKLAMDGVYEPVFYMPEGN